eukprot:scaffold1.g5214.t1
MKAAIAPDVAQEEAAAPEAPPAQTPSSRICVKNLPKYVDEKRLREHFSLKGEVTDAKIMRTRDGKSRCFGFVGFHSAAEAEAAQRYFNKSFLDTMRLVVEFAFKPGSAEGAPRAWSKYTSGTTANKKAAAAAAATAAPTGGNQVPLGGKAGGKPGGDAAARQLKSSKKKKAMQPRSKQAIWANDDLLPDGRPGARLGAAAAAAAAAPTRPRAAAVGEPLALEDEEGASDDEYEELPPRGGGGGAWAPSDGAEESEEESEEEGGGAAGGDGLVRDAAVSDLDYLRSRVRKDFDMEEEEGRGAAAGSETEEDGEDGEEATTTAGGSSAPDSGSEEEEEGEQRARRATRAAAGPGPGSTRQQEVRRDAGGGRQRRGAQAGGGGGAGDELDAIFARADGAAASSKEYTEGAEEDEEEYEEEVEEEEGGDRSDGDEEMEEAGGSVGEEGEQQGGGASEAEEDGNGEGGRRPHGAPAAVEAGDDASVGETGRLFVRNLPYGATEADLRALFEAHGEVAEVHLVLDRATRKSKGYALVQYSDPGDAVAARAELDGAPFQGRLLHVLPGKRPPPPPDAPGEGGEGGEGEGGGAPGANSFKREREAARKAGAGANRAAWNTLFMRADTVAEAVAAHFGISKAELLDREAGDMAVRMALGEAQVIGATKAALAEAGADVGKLEEAAAAAGRAAATKAVPRSDSVLLVKNLPFSATLGELESLFGTVALSWPGISSRARAGAGPLGRVVLPPTKTLALVEFLEQQDARRAFKALAYKRFQHVPLYLEWAPKAIFAGPPPPKAPRPAAAAGAKAAAGGKASARAAGAAAGLAAAAAPADADADLDTSTIFVKNLAFATTEAALRAHFEGAVGAAGGAVRAATVATKKGPDGAPLSAGFGFVECSSEGAARGAIAALQSAPLDGHRLVLALSTAGRRAGEAATGGLAGAVAAGARAAAGAKAQLPDTSKLVVRNVAFEATRKDIMGLFTPFGHVKSCRLPRKFDGSHRGFAFVDFATKQEARNAMQAVAGTHLYGRRLVLEWAEEEGGLNELRAKTAAKYRGGEELGAGARGQGEGGESGAGARRGRGAAAVVQHPPAKRQKKGAK